MSKGVGIADEYETFTGNGATLLSDILRISPIPTASRRGTSPG